MDTPWILQVQLTSIIRLLSETLREADLANGYVRSVSAEITIRL